MRDIRGELRLLRDDVSFDYDMLCALQQDCPDSELYFIVGSDKLYPLPRNDNATALMRYKGWDYICGDAVLARPVGDTLTGFLLAEASRIMDSLREAVPV